jgi:DNA-binding beta-propeller fold protein YncE
MKGHGTRITALIICLVLPGALASAYQQIEFQLEIGEPGKKAPERLLNEPRALSLAGDRIVVADTDAHRIVVLDRAGKVLQSWGQKGDEAGQFRSPAGVAVDEQGRIYVSDTGNHRVQVFDAKGAPLAGFGSKGSSPRQFNGPAGIIAGRGLLYVADSGNGRVQVFSQDGVFLTQVTGASREDLMKAPVDVAVDVRNRLYVLDADDNRVRVFDASGAQLLSFGGKGRGTAGFDRPLGLTVDGSGTIFVADRDNYKLKKFDPQGKLLGSFGSEGKGPGQFLKLAGIKVDGDGKVYVLDAGKNTLQVFAEEPGEASPLVPESPLPRAEFLREVPGEASGLVADKRIWAISGDTISALGVAAGRKIGRRGSEPGEFRNPRGVSTDGAGHFWVADTGNNRIQKFSHDGTLLQVIGRSGSGEGEFRSPAALVNGPKGIIIIADTGNQRIQVLSAKGVFLGTFGKSGSAKGNFSEPVSVALDRSENIYVADRGNGRIAKFDGSGALLWEVGKSGSGDAEFRQPENILVSPDNEIYVLDSGNCRVQVFDTNGRFLRKFGNEGKGPGELRSPLGMALEGGTKLYVGDRGNKRVAVYGLQHTPAVPAEVTAQPRMNEVQLSWKPNGETYLAQYRIYRADAPAGEFKLLAETAEPFYLDRGLPSNRAFHYRVSGAAREGNESALSSVTTALTPRLIPSTPRNVRLDASEKQIALSWLPNKEPFMNHYRIYRSDQPSSGFAAAGKTDRPVYVDSALNDETVYYYQVSAVGKEGDESQPTETAFATTPKAPLTQPPLDIARIEVREIFASSYKYYESHAIGRVIVRNNTDGPYAGAKITFAIKDYMDFPTELLVPETGPKQETDLLIKPVFSNRILEVTENTPLQSEVTLTYYVNGEARTVTRRYPLTLYERHAMTWDRKEKLGAFVTFKDPPLADFTRSTVQPYVDAYPNLHPSVVQARALYAALGVVGLKYIVDPTSPFAEFSGKVEAVDYLQYPRETLVRRSGDCDDLSVLFAAALENIGIPAAVVDVPGHVFILFNTGVPEAEREVLGFPDTQLAIHRGTVWIPLEMTMVGSSFTRAWQKGAEEYRDWSAKGKIEIIEVQKAWEEFRPVTLPAGDGKTVLVKREEIEAKFPGEIDMLGSQRLARLSQGYLAVLQKKPDDAAALSQLGILYGENGMYTEAVEQFQKLLALEKNNAMALNNIGNIYLLQERLDDAVQSYTAALHADPQDVGTMANLARALLKAGKKEEAKKRFQEAASIDPRVLRTYGDLAADLGVTK